MSYINKPGKTSAWRSMVVRQQVSDVLSYHQIVTTLTKAKITQRYLESLITLAKIDNVANRRRAARMLLKTKVFDRDALITHLFTKIAPKFKLRNGGYTRVVKKGPRRGDTAEEAILQFVLPISSPRKAKMLKAEPTKNLQKSQEAQGSKEAKATTVKGASKRAVPKNENSGRAHKDSGATG